MKAKVRKPKMKAYRITQYQVDVLKLIHTNLEDYKIQDRRARIVSADSLLEILEEIQSNAIIEVHDHLEKQKAADKAAALDKASSNLGVPSA